MKRFIIALLAAFLVFNCYGRRHHRFRRSLHHHRSSNFFHPHRLLNQKEQSTRIQLNIDNNLHNIEKAKIQHQMEMEKLKLEQRNQKHQIEKEELQKKLELLKLKKEIRQLEK